MKRILIVLALFWFSELSANAVSFDCSKASTPLEKAVCSDSELSKLDSKLTEAYKQRLLKTKNPKALKADQRCWLRFYQYQGNLKWLKTVYRQRIKEFENDECEFFLTNRLKSQSEEVKKSIVGRDLGKICNPKYKCYGSPRITLEELQKMGLSPQEETFMDLLNDKLVTRASLVDIDSDGIEELRLFQIGGSLGCMRSYLFKKDKQGIYHALRGKGYEELDEEGRFCNGDLLFIKHNGKVYMIEVYQGSGMDTVWLGSDKGLQRTCSFWCQ
jgi:uncharacterized protein YecT (DUF1311 family)